MLIAVFAVYMACLVAIATLLRDFRANGCVLAGYTVALISIIYVDAPTAAFTAMLDRVAVILLAVLALAFVSAIFTTAESARLLQSKLRLATKDIVAMALATFDRRIPPDPSQCVAMSARLIPLRSEIGLRLRNYLMDGRARRLREARCLACLKLSSLPSRRSRLAKHVRGLFDRRRRNFDYACGDRLSAP